MQGFRDSNLASKVNTASLEQLGAVLVEGHGAQSQQTVVKPYKP